MAGQWGKQPDFKAHFSQMRQHYVASASWMKRTHLASSSRMPKDAKLCWNIWQNDPVCTHTCTRQTRTKHADVLYTSTPALRFSTNNHCSGNKAYFHTGPPSTAYIKRQEGLVLFYLKESKQNADCCSQDDISAWECIWPIPSSPCVLAFPSKRRPTRERNPPWLQLQIKVCKMCNEMTVYSPLFFFDK